MKLLIDHNLSPRLARCLCALFDDEHTIVPLREKFAADAPDIEWISALSAEGDWAVLTKDLHIRTRPHEKAVLDRSRVVYFFLAGAWRKFTVQETAARLIRLIPKMAAQTDLTDQARYELPINAGSKLRQHRD